MIRFALVVIGCGLTVAARGADAPLVPPSPTDQPRPIPLTRPLLKAYLDDMKARTPRIPLPELTEEEKQNLDERGRGYEGRLRSLYLPPGDERFGGGRGTGRPGTGQPSAGQPAQGGTRPGGGFSREQDPNMTLDFAFKTSLFWIVSRVNNCHY